MNNAIKLAIEKGGYKNLTVSQYNAGKRGVLRREWYVLDPLFWRSLTKALGCDDEWADEALRYFSVVLNEEATEAYWSELLKTAENF